MDKNVNKFELAAFILQIAEIREISCMGRSKIIKPATYPHLRNIDPKLVAPSFSPFYTTNESETTQVRRILNDRGALISVFKELLGLL